MTACAITMVYRDYWALTQWYAHYSRLVGPEHLYVVAHGNDPEIARICPGASIITIPRDELKGFEHRRISFLNGLQSGFAHLYDWVIRTDADELICIDPDKHASLADLLAAHEDAPALYAQGLDLVERDTDVALNGDENVFAKRRWARPYGHYSKAFAARGQTMIAWHGIRMNPCKVDTFPYVLPEGVYLVHLKYANREALDIANKHRVAVAQVAGVGDNWRKAPARANKYYRECANQPEMTWADAIQTLRDTTLDNVKRDSDRGLVRSRSIKFPFLTELPDWFERP